MTLSSLTAPFLLLSVLAPGLANEGERDELPEAPIAGVLSRVSEDVRSFNDHIVVLASPFMEGRLPGTRGMEMAKDYVEYWMKNAGLEPAFPTDGGATSYRQPFPLDGISRLVEQSLAVSGGAGFTPDADYTALSLGSAGEASGEAVFVGYSIASGPDGYSSYTEDVDLTGKIAVLFRFEPMDEEGDSLWSDRGWSGRASFSGKIRAAADRGAAGILIVNTPGASDSRSESLPSFSMGGADADVPVFIAMPSVAEALFADTGRSVLEMRRHADEGGGIVPLGVEVSLACDISREEIRAENVGGLLPGRGDLADELVVIGAHMDHLGMGFFGSRDRESAGRALHPGADDNASGTAGILLIADWMGQAYAAAPDDASLRSVLFIAFSAEESGLNGARYYVENPIRDLDEHALMMNFDMIGRIVNRRLGVFGVGSAKGMADWIEPMFAASPLDVQPASSGGGGSDHLAFLQKEVPSLFAIIADFHEDYHTPRDTSDLINRVDAVQAAYLWRDIALEAVRRDGPFEFVEQSSGRRGGFRVRVGIRPEQGKDAGGVGVGEVVEGGAAEAAGILAGDRLVTWDGETIEDIRSWMGMLRGHEPGDEVTVGVERGGELLEIQVVLGGSDG